MAGAILQPRQSCQFLFCLMKNPLLYRSAWPESSREASERFLMETRGRTQSERRRRLALAGGFRFLRLFRIDRFDAAAHAAGSKTRKHTFMGEDYCSLASLRWPHLAPSTPIGRRLMHPAQERRGRGRDHELDHCLCSISLL